MGDGHRVTAELFGGGEVIIKLLCIDPSELLRERTDRCRAVVFFSATLTPFEYFTTVLDGAEHQATLSLDSPFPKEHLGVFLDTSVSTRYRDRERSLRSLIEYARIFAGKGNCIFFFPSYAYLAMTLAQLREVHPEIEVLAQERGLDDLGRKEFLESFVADHPEGVLAFAVLGGIFGEGIDLVGERLVAAVIVGVGLPAISNERDLIKSYYDERFGKGFSFAYTYPGMNRVLQAAGRVIRSEEDMGTVLFFGQRFGSNGYRSLLTPEFSHGITVTSHEQVQVFLEGKEQKIDV
jgi:DNA excision repair protein ERCC-2